MKNLNALDAKFALEEIHHSAGKRPFSVHNNPLWIIYYRQKSTAFPTLARKIYCNAYIYIYIYIFTVNTIMLFNQMDSFLEAGYEWIWVIKVRPHCWPLLLLTKPTSTQLLMPLPSFHTHIQTHAQATLPASSACLAIATAWWEV